MAASSTVRWDQPGTPGRMRVNYSAAGTNRRTAGRPARLGYRRMSRAETPWVRPTLPGDGVPSLTPGMATIESHVDEDMFSPEVIRDPYTYYGHLRETDPVHWNDLHKTWVITRNDDLT